MKKAISVLVLLGIMSMPGDSYAGRLIVPKISLPMIEPKVSIPSTQSAITFRLVLRQLWQYQVTWTRSYIVSVLSNMDDVAVVEDKLIKNQEKIGDAIRPYYG